MNTWQPHDPEIIREELWLHFQYWLYTQYDWIIYFLLFLNAHSNRFTFIINLLAQSELYFQTIEVLKLD
jgi:hypothetical protein